MSPGPGRLYIVATPIGNLEDMTHRAARVLGEVDVIACEDTRHSRILLDHYQIRRPTLSLHRFNEAARGGELVRRLQGGESVALISDAGAPGLSDPGARLVAQAVAAGITVVPVPGASAPVAALMAAGLEGPVVLLGFLPARAGERRRTLQTWAAVPAALLMFESPHRLQGALADLEALLGPDRPLPVARELTKLHEELFRGSVAAARAHFDQHPPRGEFTLVAGPPVAPAPASAAEPELTPDLSKEDLKRLARESGLSRSELYRRLQQLRGKLQLLAFIDGPRPPHAYGARPADARADRGPIAPSRCRARVGYNGDSMGGDFSWPKSACKKANRWKTRCAASNARCSRKTSSRRSSATPST